ncbi:hypothetical protein [Arthrobacter roseus]|uniref:hypothetical protein n=1 Tax=Arthrobacter roseus TaxID=136274 RepID=UPI001964C8C6|nr:hypothetical protein [Arthrobacter roseus]MBM7848748.1 hypothetical protein [Arthrobacter roseus]
MLQNYGAGETQPGDYITDPDTGEDAISSADNSHHTEAVENFESALNHASGPFECRVRTNLVLSLESMGDQHSSREHSAYTRELEVIEATPERCFQKDNAEAGKKLESARKRLEQNTPTKNNPAETTAQPPKAEPEESTGKLKKIQQQKRDSAQLREDTRRHEQLQDAAETHHHGLDGNPRYLFSSPSVSKNWGCWPVGPGMINSPSHR